MTERDARADLAAWWMIAVLLACYVLSMTDRLILTMLVEPIQASTGMSDFEMSLLLGPAFALPYAIAGFPFGWATDRWPRRWVQFGGLLLWTVAAMGTGLARGFWSLFASRVVVGIGEASAAPAAYSLIADRFPTKRLTTALAIYGMGPKLGTSAAFASGALAIAWATKLGTTQFAGVTLAPWQLVLAVIGSPGLLLALAIFTYSEPPRRNHLRSADLPQEAGLLAFLIANRGHLAPILLGFLIVGISANALSTWVPAYMTRDFGWSPARYGYALALISFVSAGSMLLKGYVVDWLFARGWTDIHLRFYLWLLVAVTPLLAFAFWLHRPGVFLILYGIVNVVALSYTVYSSAILQLTCPPTLRGQISAVFVLTCSAIPSAIAAPLVAAISDFYFHDKASLGFSLALVSVGSMAVSAALLIAGLKPLRAKVGELSGISQDA